MSRDFTGSPNDLSLADTATWSPTGSFAVSAWVYRDSSTEGAVVAKWQGTTDRSFILYIPTNNVVNIVTLHSLTGATATKSGFSNSAWHQVGFEFDNTNHLLRAYLDGVAGTAVGTALAPIVNSTLPTRIGSSANDGTKRYWDGAICDVAAWSSLLSSAEWLAMAKGVSALTVRPGSLLSYVPVWGVGSGEPDLSGLGNHFTVNGTLNPRNHGPVGSPFPV